MSRFIIKLTTLTFLVLLVSWLVIDRGLEKVFPMSLVWSVVFLYTVQLAQHVFLVNASRGRPQRFVAYYMGATGFKFFAVIIAIVLVGVLDPGNLLVTGVAFSGAYLLFLMLEIPELLKATRSKENEGKSGPNRKAE